MVRIYMYEAGTGDLIRIRYKADDETKYHNIIIDSGKGVPKSDRKTKTFARILSDISVSEEDQIDEVFITHWDDDHIKGFYDYLGNMTEEDKVQLGKVYMNSGALWNHPVQILKSSHSPSKGLDVAKHLTQEGIPWVDGITIESQKKEVPLVTIGGARLWIISPGNDQIRILKSEDGRVADFSEQSAGTAHAKTIKTPGSFQEELKNDFQEDSSPANGSSIAFILRYQEVSIAFLGDAHPSVCVTGLENLGYSAEKPCFVDMIKIPHHGSIANYSKTLYSMLRTDTYLLSTKGPVNKGNLVPYKSTLAHILLEAPHESPKITIYNNYSWWNNETHTSRFFKNDSDISIENKINPPGKIVRIPFEDNTYTLSLICVNHKGSEKCIKIKDDLEIYSCL